MSLTTTLKAPILKEMDDFEAAFNMSLQSKNPLLSSVNEYVRQGTGKQLRPILLLLSAKLCGGITSATINSAVGIELLHTASLIHDDVVDDANERRGRKSIKAQWSNKIAILSGDYILSNALYFGTKTGNNKILQLISNVGMQLSDGELLQMQNSELLLRITESDYFHVIRKKTALLFSTCTEIGAVSADGTEEQAACLRRFGEYLGICFQLKDDVFDYFENIDIGKPTGNDIREGKITLPLIYALNESKEEEKVQIVNWIRERNFSDENIRQILRFTHKNGGIDYAIRQMNVFKEKAIGELDAFPTNEIKKALIQCVEFSVEREK